MRTVYKLMGNLGLPLVAILLLTSCDDSKVATQLDILEQLDQIEGASATELPAVDHFNRVFEVRLTQPVDHDNPKGASFVQKIYVGHVDFTSAVVLETEGYSRSNHLTREMSSFLQINQIAVEHRYYGESVPNPRDWQYLTIRQAARDHHRIVELFKKIYPTGWISSGASKGGNAALFHRRFFPNDVEATVAYVTPILNEEFDQRFLGYYNAVGDSECRQKIKDYQRNVLLKLDSLPPYFESYVNFVNETYNVNLTFSIPYKNIIYHAIREDYPFEFWSSDLVDCSSIPSNDATASELLDHFVAALDVFLFFSDYGVDFWTPYIYQARTELGSYAYDVSYLSDLEMPIPPLIDLGVQTQFDPSVMADIANWIQTQGSRIILIYGIQDPWTVAAVEIGTQEGIDVVKITNSGTKHGTRIVDLVGPTQDYVRGQVLSWLGQ